MYVIFYQKLNRSKRFKTCFPVQLDITDLPHPNINQSVMPLTKTMPPAPYYRLMMQLKKETSSVYLPLVRPDKKTHPGYQNYLLNRNVIIITNCDKLGLSRDAHKNQKSYVDDAPKHQNL